MRAPPRRAGPGRPSTAAPAAAAAARGRESRSTRRQRRARRRRGRLTIAFASAARDCARSPRRPSAARRRSPATAPDRERKLAEGGGDRAVGQVGRGQRGGGDAAGLEQLQRDLARRRERRPASDDEHPLDARELERDWREASSARRSGSQSRSVTAVARSAAGVGLTVAGDVGCEQAERRHLSAVGLRGSNRQLFARENRNREVGGGGQRRGEVVRDREGERAPPRRPALRGSRSRPASVPTARSRAGTSRPGRSRRRSKLSARSSPGTRSAPRAARRRTRRRKRRCPRSHGRPS